MCTTSTDRPRRKRRPTTGPIQSGKGSNPIGPMDGKAGDPREGDLPPEGNQRLVDKKDKTAPGQGRSNQLAKVQSPFNHLAATLLCGLGPVHPFRAMLKDPVGLLSNKLRYHHQTHRHRLRQLRRKRMRS